MRILKYSILSLIFIFPAIVNAQVAELQRNFKSPSAEYSILPFWSWNGTLTADKLTWQIDQMLDKGVYGAFMHARAGLDESETPYFSDGFWAAVDTTIKYSAKKGFNAYLYDEDKWPSGSAGGRTVAANPEEFIKKGLFYNKMEVFGPQTITINLHEKPMAVFAGRISANGKYDFSSQIDLTEKAGKEWNVPDGLWAIISFEIVKDPGEQIDYLDSAAVAKFIEITHEEYYKRYGMYFGNTIPGIFFDEIFANFSKMDNNIFWTDDFIQQFKSIKGYDLSENLPLLFFSDPVFSAKVRFDYFDVVRKLFIKAWFKQYADWCEKHHIWATGHTTEKLTHYRRQSDYFSTMGQLQVPGADNEEYRYGFPRMIDWYNTKQISSIANLYNRKRVMVEAMGGGGYTIPLEEYRYGFSMLGAYGINMFIPHLFHYEMNTPESQSDWPPSWFFRNPYWKYFKPLADFGSRISFMISQGDEVCDVAVLYPLTGAWEGGYPDKSDDTFYKDVQQNLIDNHINYNIIDPESLVKATIADKKIVAGKGKYSILVLPEIQTIRTEAIVQIERFIENGGMVIALKGLPSLSEMGPTGDELVNSTVKKLFGIKASDLRQQEYYHWNADKTKHYISKSNQEGGTAYFSRFLAELPEMIHSRIKPDLQVLSENTGFFHFNHHRIDNIESYLFVNDKNSAEKYRISIRETGTPSIWDPETGEVLTFGNYRLNDGRMELILDFKPRQSYFLVLNPEQSKTSESLIENTDLTDYRITETGNSVKIEGWGKSGEAHFVELQTIEEQVIKRWKSELGLAEINVTGDWQFQFVPHKLDYIWSSSVASDTISLPIMKFQPERILGEGLKKNWRSDNFNDSNWKVVKITDEYNRKQGIQRYLSDWDAAWISYYDFSKHLPEISGENCTFKKELFISNAVKSAKLAITSDPEYELFVNGIKVGNGIDWKKVGVSEISEFLKTGNNNIEVKTQNTRGLLIQGDIHLKNGEIIPVKSDESWMVSLSEAEAQSAFRFSDPPLGVWGNIRSPLQKVEFPITVWYRRLLPPGVTSLLKPDVKGKYSIFINGIKLNPDWSGDICDISGWMNQKNNFISISVVADDETCGLIQPLKLICKKVEKPLVSWDEMGVSWYSGRAMYSKNIEIPSEYINKQTRLILDLGQVNYFAEIWVNGKLVTFCPWAPFEVDISHFVRSGENEITVVVANLRANEASWNILDNNIDNKAARWWHNGSLMREKEKLESGLKGPVKIVPYSMETVMVVTKN
ncbi:MAG: glycosyl hydrolase [Draconibacterium sp.]